MSRKTPDPKIDAQLRKVALPEGFLSRLRQSLIPDDEMLDDELRGVRIPEGLASRLRAAIADEALDEQIRDLPVPVALAPRLRVMAQQRQRSTVRLLALAASLFLMVSTGYLTGLTVLLHSLAPQPNSPITLQVIYDGPLELESFLVEQSGPTPQTLVAGPPLDAGDKRIEDAPRIELLDDRPALASGPAGSLFRGLELGLRLADDTLVLRWGVIGYPHDSDDRLPEMEISRPPAPRGMAAPLAAGFDRQFLFSKNTQPVVFLPAAHPELSQVTAPLSTAATSLDDTWRLVKQGRLPEVDEVIVEDFLAAMDYQFPLPRPGRLAAYRAGGPSPFGPPGSALLQVAAKAGAAPVRRQSPTHLTIALDISASMRWDNRLANCQQAIQHMTRQLGPRDRLSLIAFNEEVQQAVEVASLDDRDDFLQILGGLRCSGGTNLSAGLQQAILQSMGTAVDADVARQVVLITDDRQRNPPQVAAKLQSLVRETTRNGLVIHLLDLAEQPDGKSLFSQLALASGGRSFPARNSEQIRWALHELVIGASSVVASDAVMRVTFNPKVVASYRLLGHEATQLGGLMPAAVPATLRAGEEACLLFEITLIPGQEDDLARLELTWNDPSTGQSRRLRQRISRLQLAPSFAESALSLQAAAIAAETAEVLRQSPFASSRNRDLRAVREVAERVNPRLAQRSGFQRFLRLMDRIADLPQIRRNQDLSGPRS